ncbi:MAG TPA: alpha/beta hydrolase fold domain-containing protein [Bacteroidota bacterium]|nr:alpha/beta hydrolase fold domain-containing protein [Bacteroidota bacterium]
MMIALKLACLGLFCSLLGAPVFAQGYVVYRDLPYDTIPGVDPRLLAVDVYIPKGAAGALPLVAYVHGGYWNAGDKAYVGSKADLCTSNGYAFASVNYRLSPDPPDTAVADAVRHPLHARDLAHALAWLHRNAAAYSIDTSRILLLGHSAGAQLVDIVSSNPRFLEEAGLSLHSIRGTCSLDAGVLDVPWEMYQARNLPVRAIPLLNAFGKDTAMWIDASPLRQIRADRAIPPFLIVHQNTADRVSSSVEFRDSLRANGFIASNFNAAPYDHGEINAYLGDARDTNGMTDSVMAFFARCVGNTLTAFAISTSPGLTCQIYPNPASSSITLKSDAAMNARITDLLGREIWRGRIDGTVTLHAASWNAGVYLLFAGTQVYRISKL